MILLIPNNTKLVRHNRKIFKFHYDSINSFYSYPHLLCVKVFKFHYDSINSMEKSQTNV